MMLAFSPSWQMAYYINYRINKCGSLYVQLQTHNITGCVKNLISHLDVLSITVPNIWILGHVGRGTDFYFPPGCLTLVVHSY